MKVYKSCYRSHWISPLTIVERIFFWTEWSRQGRIHLVVEDKDYVEMPAWAYKLADGIEPLSRALQWFLDKIHPQINYVKLDRWDTWSMDHTLADIVLPMLKQLKETKHGAPFTDDEDVPEYLRSHMAQPKEYEWDTDSLHFQRWDWILDEMIWAFEQKVIDDAEGQFFDHSAYDGSRLGDQEYLDDITNNVSKVKYDKEGHEAWSKRKANGFRLFGKYFESLWD
jgi:hypothetical protein